jgi:hypothetical protein
MEGKKIMKTNLSKLFEGTQILDPTKGSSIPLSSLWENNTKPLLLISWLRRFG